MANSSSAEPTAAHAAAQLIAAYHNDPALYDELLQADGAVRAPWQGVLEAFTRMDRPQRQAARLALLRILRENRVTYVTQDEAGSTRRPWKLDLFPMLIGPGEWQLLEKGLIQRARLLNAILGDLYGPQRSLKEGRLPASVVFSNPQFLRPCVNIPTHDGIHLHLLAFDVARAQDGSWWILSDRTEAPSGAGYALENRIATSRALPDMFAENNVHRHAGFFRAFNDYFLSLSNRDEPLAVFLSYGPGQRAYFEHAYLARYLGYSVVEGSDLAVRNNRLFLKTVDGLRAVDLVLRTVRSEMCDPLELRTDSLSGVPGLLQAARAGKVTVGNSLGSGLVESDAFLSFLPTLSRFFLDEELLVPSIATWWCGQDAENKYVTEHIDELIVRRISTSNSLLTGDLEHRVGEDMSATERAKLIEQIRHHGHDFIGQEPLTLSTAPTWASDDTLVPTPIMFRMFVAATADGYRVLPGALARVYSEAPSGATWLSTGDVSKDTWILSDEPVENVSLLAQRLDSTWLRRSGRDLPSRAADNLFWLGRYAERAEAAVRLLRSLVMRLHGETSASFDMIAPERLVSLLISQKHLSPRRGKRALQLGRDAVEQELWTILFDSESPDGLTTVLNNVHRIADAVRERLSGDAFRILNDLSEVPHLREQRPRQELSDGLGLLNRLIEYLAAFNGMVMENMTRATGWRFLDMGRRIERVRTMSELLQQLAVRGEPQKDGALELLLDLADSTMTYLSRYHSPPQLARVLDLLMADESNPRSVAFQIASIADHLNALAPSATDGLLGADQKITTSIMSQLRLADAFELGDTVSRFGTRIMLDRLNKEIEKGIKELSDHVTRQYFSHSAPRRVTSVERRREPR